MKAPSHSEFSSNISFTLPSKDGNANQVLKTDGSGKLDWIDQSAGSSYFTESTDSSGENMITYDFDIYCKNLFFKGSSSSLPYKSLTALYGDIYTVMGIQGQTTIGSAGTTYIHCSKLNPPSLNGYLKYDGNAWIVDNTVSSGSVSSGSGTKYLHNRALDISDNEILTFEHIPDGDSYQIKIKIRSKTSISNYWKTFEYYAHTSTPALTDFDDAYPSHIHTVLGENIPYWNSDVAGDGLLKSTETFESGELQTPENNSGEIEISIRYHVLTGDIFRYITNCNISKKNICGME